MKPLRTLALELVAFVALAWYAAAHWASGLVADTPGLRVLACVAVAGGVGAAVAFAAPLRLLPRTLLRVACALAGLGAGLIAMGLERRLLAPAHWDELGDGLDRGFAALGSIQWPYDGAEPWASLVLLFAVPLVLAAAAVLAFWGNGRLRPAAVVLLVALYGVAVTEHRFDGELGRGVGLLFLVAAWLWLPRMPDRGARAVIVAAGAVFVACLAALPAAARYDDREPLLDYESWNPFGAQATTSFDWSHSYGPIDWPREGTTLMHVRSDERHYWKVQTLDRFDGFRWVRSGRGRGDPPLLPSPYDRTAETSFRVTIRDLDTDLFPIAGTALEITGADPVVLTSEDGTVEALGEPLEEGDTYTVEAYVPEPTPTEMRYSPPQVYLSEEIRPYTEILLPPPGTRAAARGPLPGDASRSAAPPPVPATRAEIAASPYGRMFDLARRLARGQSSDYDVARAVQSHLRTEYAYSEQPPRRAFPLTAFLFRDRIGYCQQFSGAMALMLRMLNIPARVAAGFTPGSYNADTEEYRVRDLDAHSWVEVWFEGVGWVPFDPTPAVAPADLQASVNAASASRGATTAGETPDPGQTSTPAPQGDGPRASDGDGAPALQGWMAIAAFVLIGAVAVGIPRVRRLLQRSRRDGEDREVAALRRALEGVGGALPPRMTLRELELRLQRSGDSQAARYARMVRERRFGARGGQAPDGAARRALWRALTRGRGPRARLAALAALPPVSFRRG